VVARAEAGMARVVGWTASAHERHDLDRVRSPLPAQVGADPVEDLCVPQSISWRMCDRVPESILGARLAQSNELERNSRGID
jgi:hypothetical protein